MFHCTLRKNIPSMRFFKKCAFGGVFNKTYGECWCRSVGADSSEASLDQVPIGTGLCREIRRRSIFQDDVLYFRTPFYISGRRSIFHDDVLYFRTLFYISGHRSIFQDVVLVFKTPSFFCDLFSYIIFNLITLQNCKI